ncbi:hypothetical protein [Phaeobacter inhibens]|uniref:hypothetical protein n=1 Tax=Phaeobacter inhibens TaxID=221822 RepID=UPI00076BBBD9|nr:hypothetical protein [Phaeobacter inhibens]KXF90825.1 hypothetical protein AT574_09460 [Phaeobacter inhibens]WHP67223.1 hypothetical protein QMZ01_11760 [Phaeobacter inhibens]
MMPRFRMTPQSMRGLALAGLLVLPLTAPVAAETAPAPVDEGSSLMQRGAELFWEGLRQEMAPALDDLQALADEFGPSLQGFLSEMGPALAEIAGKVEDWSVYDRPEILPNGDIIIRRKPEAAPDETPDATPEGQQDEVLPEGTTDL